mgnify:FL=1
MCCGYLWLIEILQAHNIIPIFEHVFEVIFFIGCRYKPF